MDLKEIESLNMERANRIKKLEDEKLKLKREKEEAREAKKFEKIKAEEEKKKVEEEKRSSLAIRKESADQEKKILIEKNKVQADKRKREDQEINVDQGKKSRDQKEISQKVLDVVGSEHLCSMDDLFLIEDFLQGRYKIHSETRQILLQERRYQDENDNTRREQILLILDYSQCKWKKIKKTAPVILKPASPVPETV